MSDFWTKSYPEGVNGEITSSNKNLIEFFDETLKKYSDRTLVSNMGVSYTYGQIDETAQNVASWLQAQGYDKGTSVAIMMPNVIQYLPIVIGTLRAGMVLTLINPLYTSRELKYQLVDADAKIIFILEPFCNTLEPIVSHSPIEQVVISAIGDMLGSLKGTLVNAAAKHIKKAIPKYALESNDDQHVIKFKQMLKDGAKYTFTSPEVSPDDLALIQYTGGTTGVAKGILISHDNVVFGTKQYQEWFKPISKEVDENLQMTNIIALPFYHIFAFIMSLLGMRMGQHLVFVTNPRDIDGFVKLLSKQPFHMLPAVNTLFHALLQHPDFNKIDFSHLKLSLAGGMAATPEMARKWQETTGVPIIEGWGMSETLGVGTANPISGQEFTGTIGLPLPGIDLEIRDEDENKLEVGEVGEIVIKGGNVIKGYHHLDNTEFFTKDGFLKTGDIATMDAKGYVKLHDRKKDMLIVSGFNVYPNEIEGVIEMHPKVRECSVVGVDDEVQGQSVKVFVVKDDSSLNKNEIIEFCKKNLAGYKRPRHIEFIDELPKSTVGKILRHKLRSMSTTK